jgi:hypothetical protein
MMFEKRHLKKRVIAQAPRTVELHIFAATASLPATTFPFRFRHSVSTPSQVLFKSTMQQREALE